jgi:hypothetical protein
MKDSRIALKENKSLTITAKEKPIMPDMHKILSKSVNTTIEEIENGYLIVKRYEMRYQSKDGESNWFEYCTKTYSEENPIQPSEPKSGTIADFF